MKKLTLLTLCTFAAVAPLHAFDMDPTPEKTVVTKKNDKSENKQDDIFIVEKADTAQIMNEIENIKQQLRVANQKRFEIYCFDIIDSYDENKSIVRINFLEEEQKLLKKLLRCDKYSLDEKEIFTLYNNNVETFVKNMDLLWKEELKTRVYRPSLPVIPLDIFHGKEDEVKEKIAKEIKKTDDQLNKMTNFNGKLKKEKEECLKKRKEMLKTYMGAEKDYVQKMNILELYVNNEQEFLIYSMEPEQSPSYKENEREYGEERPLPPIPGQNS